MPGRPVPPNALGGFDTPDNVFSIKPMRGGSTVYDRQGSVRHVSISVASGSHAKTHILSGIQSPSQDSIHTSPNSSFQSGWGMLRQVSINVNLALTAISSTHLQSSRHHLMARSAPLPITLSGPSKSESATPLVMEQRPWYPQAQNICLP
jgi:hypothetical protein